MASESPTRTTLLANALLTASQAGQDSPYLALSATGGPLFHRVRRLVSPELSGDTIVKKTVWLGMLFTVVAVGAVRLDWQLPTLAAQETPSEDPAPAEPESDTPAATAPADEVNTASAAPAESNPLGEYAGRIVVGDNEVLKKFVELTKTPTARL